MLRGLIFDFDGLIADTETVWYRVLCRLYTAHGATLPYALWRSGVGHGPDAFDPFATLAGLVGGRHSRAALEAQGERMFRTAMRGVRTRPGVVPFVARATAAGLRLAVASSSRRASVEPYLYRFGLRRHFAYVATGDDVTRIKPAPDLYLLALRGLGLRAPEAVALEDSGVGLRAATAAGLRCVVVPTWATADHDFTTSCCVVKSLRGLDPLTL
ncbi:MAG: hypothetical protein AUI14_09045 [Actinobacteria bacterium 13_2_20CM_2_71_6]|nr:MAG: hypothetical protein AUI14_09045 [Actinobacteria bacterium 13_2_20CM_2_71_6]